MRRKKRTNHQAKQVIEDRDCGSNNPSENPERRCNSNPGSDSDEAALAHVIGTCEDTHVYRFAADMPVDDSSNNNLWTQLLTL